MNPQSSEENADSAMSSSTRRGSAKPWWALSISYFTGMLLFLWWARSGAGLWLGIVVVLGVFLVTGSFSVIIAHRERKKFGYFRVQENPESFDQSDQPDLARDSDNTCEAKANIAETAQKQEAEIHFIENQRAELRQITSEINSQEDQLHTGTGN